MQELTLYNDLWNLSVDAKKVAHDRNRPASIRAIAYYLSHEYADCQKLYEEHADSVSGSKDVFWGEVNLMLQYRQAKKLSTLQKAAEDLLSSWKGSIFGRILLATIYAQQGRYEEATLMCETILSENPKSVIVLPTLLAIYIGARKIDYARQAWQKGKRSISGVKDWRKRIRWYVAFFVYSFQLYPAKSILLSIVVFAVSILPLWTSLYMLSVITSALVLIRLFFQLKQDRLAVSISTRLILIVMLAWLTGYGTKSLFVLVEGI